MKEYQVLAYTRLPQEDAVYAEKLADSMHLAVRTPEGEIVVLNHNSGILYAKATQDQEGCLHAKSMKSPYLFRMADGSFGVVAVRINADRSEDESARGKILLFKSRDLLKYEEAGLIELPEDDYIEEVYCEYETESASYLLQWSNQSGQWHYGICRTLGAGTEMTETGSAKPVTPEVFAADWQEHLTGVCPCNTICVSEEIGQRLIRKLTVPVNTGNTVPEKIQASGAEEIRLVKAVAHYSDGSSVAKRVDWDLSGIDFDKKGICHLTGRVHQDHYEFPMALNRADPCIGRWNGKYYYIATNDADGNHSLYMRCADSIPELVTAEESLILDSDTYPHIKGLLWAPEFHIIRGRLYLFHAATRGEFGQEQSHVMALKEGGDPMKASDWEMPVRVVKQDGSELCTNGITLDMTEYEVGGRYYVMWSQRQFVPIDLGAWIYIAELNPEEPWRLMSEPVVISMPEYGWANNHTFVDEGPFALITDQKLYVSFSSAAIDSTYVVGMLSADLNADLLNPASWEKCGYPLMSSRCQEGEFGTGHNAYVQDADGLIWNTYHAKPGIDAPRSSGIRRVHFDAEGCPVLDMTEEYDLVKEHAEVSIEVEIR